MLNNPRITGLKGNYFWKTSKRKKKKKGRGSAEGTKHFDVINTSLTNSRNNDHLQYSRTTVPNGVELAFRVKLRKV